MLTISSALSKMCLIVMRPGSIKCSRTAARRYRLASALEIAFTGTVARMTASAAFFRVLPR